MQFYNGIGSKIEFGLEGNCGLEPLSTGPRSAVVHPVLYVQSSISLLSLKLSESFKLIRCLTQRFTHFISLILFDIFEDNRDALLLTCNTIL